MSSASHRRTSNRSNRAATSTPASEMHVALPTSAGEAGSSAVAEPRSHAAAQKRKRKGSDSDVDADTSSTDSNSSLTASSRSLLAIRDSFNSVIARVRRRGPSPTLEDRARPPPKVRRKRNNIDTIADEGDVPLPAHATEPPGEPDISDERIKVSTSTVHPKMLYPAYRDGDLRGVLDFVKINAQTWAAEVFDPSRPFQRQHGIDKWAIVRAEAYIDGRTTYFCSRCPDFRAFGTCCHVLLLEHDECPAFRERAKSDESNVVGFDNDTTSPKGLQIVSFLCISPDMEGTQVVTFCGEASNMGRWRCSKHQEPVYVRPDGTIGEACTHIQQCHASELVLELLWFREDAAEHVPVPQTQDEHLADELDKAAKRQKKQQWQERSVSYMPVGPPEWSRLPNDTVESFPTTWPPPPFIPLGDEARCQCGELADMTAEKRRQPVLVYGMSQAIEITIETVACGRCSPQSGMNRAGPDMRRYGLFNYDNKKIFAHDLLNDYTQSIISFTAPFSAYAKVVDYRYRNSHCKKRFVNNHLWVTVWFAFSRVQQLRDSFSCVLCGPNPRVIILDGQTDGFKRQHVLRSLCPPTFLRPGRTVRENVVVQKERTSAIKHKIRLLGHRIVRWRKGLTSTGSSAVKGISANETIAEAADADADDTGAKKQQEKRKADRTKNDKEMRAKIDDVVKTLHAEGLSVVARVFESVVKPQYDEEKEVRCGMYLSLLNEIFAHESILMFVPVPTWPTLRLLEKGDKTAAMALTREVPAVGAVAMLEVRSKGAISKELRSLAKWLADRAQDVWAALPQHQPDQPDEGHDPGEEASIEAGTFYGRKRVRLRPEYPNLPHDRATDRATLSNEAETGGIGCSKFYEWYGMRGITGGIMGCWCPHLISLGFHLIPKGEGRNDVFSALYCYWKEAPWYVVYDFGCALGPYCLAREPEFFKNTRFVIDGFHAKGHTRCSPACFLSTYRTTNANLDSVNSSAAECGNAGLARIRKALMFMTQEHAMIFILVFLAMWNRARRLEDPRLLQSVGPDIPTDPNDICKMDFGRVGAGSTILGWLPSVEEEENNEGDEPQTDIDTTA